MAVLADAYDAFLFDLDGVLYRGSEVVAGAPEAVARLRAAGKRVAFVTNNATRTPESVAARLTGFGIPASADEVESSALVTAAQLAARGVSEAFVVGEEGILQALQDKGIAIADVDAGSTEVVVVGLDRRVDYEKLRRASLLVQHGANLVATNTDASYPATDGNWPGAGALLAVDRGDDRRASRGVRQAGGAHHARGARTRGRRNAARHRRSAGDGHRRGGGARVGLAPRAHGDRERRGRRSVADRADVRGRRSHRALRASGRPEGSSEPGVCWPDDPQRPKETPMVTTLDEIRKTIEALIGNMTPAKAQELAKGFSDPGTAKEQVSKMAADLLDWSQRSRERLKETISREIASQMQSMGVATQADLDAVKKRVRDLERRAGMTASGRSAAKKTAARKSAAKKSAAKRRRREAGDARLIVGRTACLVGGSMWSSSGEDWRTAGPRPRRPWRPGW